ncbi:MAG: tetratricopeptide repeat protein [Acidobacteria bacterium]|nr:tetratricopeptide repeat protein [Acidobacteriota bacterium]
MILLVLLGGTLAYSQQAAPEPDSYLKKGLDAYAAGDFDTAIRQWTEGLTVAEQTQDDLFLGTFYGNLALAYRGRGERTKAIGLLEKAVEVARRVDDRQGLKTRLNNLGGLYLLERKPSPAIDVLDQALRIARELDDRELAANIRNNLGQAYLLTGENLRAAALFQETLAFAAEQKDARQQAESASHLGAAQAAIGNYAQALNHFRLALSLVQDVTSGEEIARLRIRTYQRMALLTRDLGDIAAAYTFEKAAAAEADRTGLAAERAESERQAGEIAALDDGSPATRQRLRVEGLIRMRDRLRAHGLDELASQVEKRISEAPSHPRPGPD